MAGGGFSQPKKTKNASPLTNPFREVLQMPSKTEEYSFPFPKETKFFDVKLRKQAILKTSYLQNEIVSGTKWGSGGRGYAMGDMELTDELVVYFQSSKDGDTLEIHYWT